jgi:ATP-dependent protease ClpP protease subunit
VTRCPRMWNTADEDTLRAHHLRTTRPVAKLRQGRTDWYKITNLADDTAELYIYDEIGWFGVTAADLANELRAVTASTISVRLNSPGGDVFDGIAILNALRSHPAAVNVTVDSLAASIASVIAMAGDTVTMAPNSQMMIHAASGIVIGDAVDMREMADLLDKQTQNIASIYQSRAGGKLSDWRAAMDAETWYSAQEAVDAGLADEVGSTGKAPQNNWDLSIYAHAGREQAPAPDVHDAGAFDFDPDAFRQSVRNGTTPAQPEPEFKFDPDVFRQTMRKVAG